MAPSPLVLLRLAAPLATVLLATACSRKSAPPAPLRVAAASDLSHAFDEVGRAYEKETGQAVAFSFGATGLLERQIAEGAPFDVFAAANVTYADQAAQAGACLPDTKALYATGHLVMYARADAAFVPKTLADLADPRIAKVALANPDHAPYGMAAKQAIQRAGLWDRVQPKLVYGENVRQAFEFARTGNADVALIALSLVLGSGSTYADVPANLYDRIDQAIVACKNGKAGPDGGRRFVAFVASAKGHTILRRYGFLLPGDAPVAP